VRHGTGRHGAGDGWTRCSRGHRHWGRHGAAGLLLHVVDDAGDTWVLLQHRAWWSHHGGTWGLPGGARLSATESPEQAALRETSEEIRVDLGGVALGGTHADDHGGWAYTTVLARLGECRSVAPAADETLDAQWVPAINVDTLPLHPGFAAAWPSLQDRLR